jgi:hypothetical protein
MSYTIDVNGTKHTGDAERDTPLLLRDIAERACASSRSGI